MTLPNPDRVQAFVARCLIDPTSLSLALPPSDDQDVMQAFGRSELDRLALFRSFIVKVKHNGVREVLPITFRMLSAIGEELAFYRTHATDYLAIRAQGPIPLPRLVQLITENLHRYLDGRQDDAARALSDIAMHELTVWRMLSDQHLHRLSVADGALAWQGRMKVKAYATDIGRISRALATGTFDPAGDTAAHELTVAYWLQQGKDSVESFELDELTAMLFTMVDGLKSIGDIGDELDAIGLDQITPADLRRFFDELADRGFIEPLGGEFGPERAVA
jgi:hypothetical protein